MKRIAYPLQVLAYFGLAMSVAGASAMGAEGFSNPVKATTVNYDFSNHSMTKWQNGRLLSIDFFNDSVVAFDEHGTEILRTKIQLPDAVRVGVNDITASTTGQLAVAVSAFSAEGASASFILWLDPHGSVLKAVRTTPFASMRISFSSDGTLWSVGREHDADHRDVPGHNIINHFGTDGLSLGSSLPVTSFAQGPALPHPGLSSFFATMSDRVGLYATTTQEWIEVSSSGNVIGRWPGPPVKSVNGVAVTDSGNVFLSASVAATTTNRAQSVVFRLDKKSAAWVPVSGGESRYILGAQGGNLVVRGKWPVVNWYEVD